MNNVCICIFAKAPVQGEVKTRLLPVLSEQQACLAHENLLIHCIENTRSQDWHSELWTTDIRHPFIQQCAQQYSLPLNLQQGDGLGEKMLFAIQTSLKKFTYAIVIGTDCPDLNSTYISEAISHLQAGTDLVLGPAQDGGYVLIGMSISVENVFRNMPWGTDKVLAITRERLKEANIKWHELTALRDIDRPEDLEFLSGRYPQIFIQ